MTPKRKASPSEPVTSKAQRPGAKRATESPDGSENDASPGCIQFTVPMNNKSITCERHGGSGHPRLVFTHGAGGGIADGPTKAFALGFAQLASMVNFQGSLNLTSRVKAFNVVADHIGGPHLALGGRSMGARAAVLTALERSSKPQALILESYPLRAGKKGETREYERREKILTDLPPDIDVLFIIGSRDLQCNVDDLAAMRQAMSSKTWLVEVRDADHGLSIKSKNGTQQVRLRTGSVAAEWLQSRDEGRNYCKLEWSEAEERVLGGGWTAISDHREAG